MTDYSDLVKRLRDYPVWTGDCHDAADAIEHLMLEIDVLDEHWRKDKKRIAELEVALKPFADAAHFKVTKTTGTVIENSTWEIIVKETDLRQARKVLGEKE